MLLPGKIAISVCKKEGGETVKENRKKEGPCKGVVIQMQLEIFFEILPTPLPSPPPSRSPPLPPNSSPEAL